ncbi:hypothetical protein EKL32_28625 [Flavobacterium sp. GSN2]|nr:hypothetical protein EKL32_28625 [Flavobacterium sp. GSN2]
MLSFLLSSYWLLEIYIFKLHSQMIPERVLGICICSFALSIVFFLIQNRKLYFRQIDVSYSENQFQEAIKKTVEDLEWIIDVNKKDLFRAYRPSNWTGSWGEMITIIKKDNQILFNSICDPNLKSSILSYGWNNKNRKQFLSNLESVKAENK